MACFCSRPFVSVAQLPADIFSGPPDVLYSQSELFNSLDRVWSFSPPAIKTPLELFNSDDRFSSLDPLDQPPAAETERYLDSPLQDKRSRQPTHFRWVPAIGESLLFTGVMHAFNITTEAGTRDALNGPWLKDYLRSVSELRGWSDSDRFMAPYVGHPIEGSVFGFIERQNDPKFRLVQWGDGREYWVSMLRSMAYSAVWHTQWKIGPASEASIGNVMLHASPGFICLVDTPTLGFVVMLAEDISDRYIITGLENRSTNRTLIILARSFLNPGRTFANVMAFRIPWNRDTRIGVFGANSEIRKQLLEDYKSGNGEKPFAYKKDAWNSPGIEFTHLHPKEAGIELTAFPYYETFLGGGSCLGGGGSGAARVNPEFQVITEVSGCLVMHQPQYEMSADSLFYGGGFRWTPWAARRISPFVQFMLGGRKVTYEVDNLTLKKQLLSEWNNGNGSLPHYPMRSAWSVETAQNGPSIAVGGGCDWIVTRPFAWRILNVEYTRSWMGDVGRVRPQEGVKISKRSCALVPGDKPKAKVATSEKGGVGVLCAPGDRG
jgi:hypothetical protein